MMKKQEFVPRKISEKPLYELKSVEDIPVSELYQVRMPESKKFRKQEMNSKQHARSWKSPA